MELFGNCQTQIGVQGDDKMVEKTPRWTSTCQITHDGEDYDAESIEEISTMENCYD